MPKVNYIREINRFMEYACDEHVTASERLLWYALMHICNQRAQGAVWPDEYIRVSNDRLLSLCPMKYDTMVTARNGLKQRGLIEFIKGEKNKLSPAYRMCYFFPEYVSSDTCYDERSEVYPKISDYMGGNMGGNTGGNMGGNSGGNMGDFILNNNQGNTLTFPEEEEDDDEQLYRARTEEASTAYQTLFGTKCPGLAAQRLALTAVRMNAAAGLISKALSKAASKGAGSPIDYTEALMDDWRAHHITDAEGAERYAFLRDVADGKTMGDRQEAMDELEAMIRGKTN